MQINHLSLSILVKLIIFFIYCSIFLFIEANHNENFGFSAVLIHRDSSLSPFSDPNLSNAQRQDVAFKRILHRQKNEHVGSQILIFDDYSYLMKIFYGDPPHEFFQIIDSSTDLSWIQCEPCVHCFPSEHLHYLPNISRTFVYEKCHQNKRCAYDISYKDKSYSRGVLARETIRLDSSSPRKARIDNFLFGCGYNNSGRYSPKGAGIIGFNSKEHSFLSQLSSRFHGKFAYCMAPSASPHQGKIIFGYDAVIHGDGVIKTSLIIDSDYYVMLEGVAVATKKVKYFPYQYSSSLRLPSNHSRINGGKMLIDTRTNVMILPPPLQKHVETLVRHHIKAKPIARPPSPFSLCYPASLMDHEIPNITLHFPSVELVLSPLHTFGPTPSGDRCLAICAEGHLPVLGIMAQVNFFVGFDLRAKLLKFKPTNCSNLNV